MLKGLTLTELAVELDRQKSTKRDFIATNESIHFSDNNELVVDLSSSSEVFPVNRTAERNIAQYTKIPQDYFDRLPGELRARNVNHWLEQKPKDGRFVRTLDGHARAFLSNGYEIIDNDQIAEAVLPILGEQQDLVIQSAHISDDKFYLKALFPRIQQDVAVGDTVQAGVLVSNSEVGDASFRIEPLVYRLVCLNGLVTQDAFKRFHTGSRKDASVSREYLREETLVARDKATLLEIQDLVRAATDIAVFQRSVEKLSETQDWRFDAPAAEVVERTKERFSLTEGEKNSVLDHLINGGDLSGYGLLNAVTKTAHTHEDITYDRSVELERVGGKIIDFTEDQWKSLAA